MKSTLKITLMLCSLIFIFSCSNEDKESTKELSQFETDALKIDELLNAYRPNLEYKSSTMSDDKVITFEVVKNLKTNIITIENEKVVSFFPIDTKSSYYNRSSGAYQVDCTGGSSGDWSESCDGKWSCGRLIAQCLDEGGCAAICEQEISDRLSSSSERLYASVEVTYLPVR